MKKTISWILIFAIVLVQCPLEVRAAGASSAGGSSTALAPFQSEFYRTNLITGTASLSVPIVVPPGRKGIQPSLALSYSSSGGNSWCGVGWNLDLGSIQRDTREGIPKYNNTDTFIATVSGANMKLVNIGDSEYRAQIESGFMRFIYKEADNYWEVYDKGGTKYRFGLNADSQITNSNGTLSWSLDEVLDTNGNYMAISYTKDQGQIHPLRIEYTGNKSTGYTPKHTVEFILESRTDFPSSYRSGHKIVTAQILKEIHLKTNGEWVRRYVLTYEYSPDTNRSILTKVTEYGQDGITALPSEKTFTYSARGTNPGGAMYDDLILSGGTKPIDGTLHFNSITLKDGAVLTCSPGLIGTTLLVDEFVNLENGSRIDLDGKGYAGGAGGAGGSRGLHDGNCGGRGGQAGQPGEGPGAGTGGSGGGDGETWGITLYIQYNVILMWLLGSGGGGGGKGAEVEDSEGVLQAAGGLAGTRISQSTYEQSSAHAGSGGGGGCGAGGGASFATGNIAVSDLIWYDGSDGESGGDGGSGGGYLEISCKNLTIDNTCSISARGEGGAAGGNGGAGWANTDGSNGSGGGGGNGGNGGCGGGIILEIEEALTNNGTILVNGGNGGPGGAAGEQYGQSGLTGYGGAGGRLELYYGTKVGSGTYGHSGGSGAVNGNEGVLHEESTSEVQTLSIEEQAFAQSTIQSGPTETVIPSSVDFESGDNLWNVCFKNEDNGPDNYGAVVPSTFFNDDGTPKHEVFIQSLYESGVWWTIDDDGDIHYAGPQDHYICAWTYLYVKEAKILSLSYYNQVDHNAGFYLVPEDTPEGTSWSDLLVDKTGISLEPGYNTLYITSYNENQGFRLEMEGGVANQVDFMNSSAVTPQFKLSPLMGDFNGDGRVDRGRYYKETGIWEVSLSEGDTFGTFSNWRSGFGASTDCEPIVSDFNSDGLTDVGVYNKATGDWSIALSDGFQFNPDGNWLSGFNAGEQYLPIVGDFNSDTKIDVGTYNQSSGTWSVALSGSSFSSDGDWLTGFGGSDAYDAISGDFNGDGLTDVGVHHKESGDVSVALCNGSNFISSEEWIPGFAPNKTILTGDFNNDGLADIGSFDNEQGLWSMALCTGASFSEEGCWLKDFGQGKYITAHTGDFSGDGINNAGIFDWENETWAHILSNACPSDLLVEFSNGLGGKTSIAYEPSTAYDNTGVDSLSDLPFPIQTVSQVSIEDGLGNPAHTINYTYEDGLFDFKEKEFIGFGKVTVIDAEGNISDAWYNQDIVDGLYIYKGMPIKQELKKQLPDESIELYQRKSYSYDYTTPYPGLNYLPQLTQEESSSYDGMASPKTSKVSYQYDTYGNVTVINSAGDIDVAGDERKQHTEYTYNTTSWILNRPAHTWLEDADGQKVSESWHYYDDHSNYTDTPTKGNLTQEETWLDTAENPTTSYDYDDYGNVTKTTDARNNTTNTTYEGTYHTYPESITNALGHTIQYTYEPKTGQIVSTTDPNGQTSTNEYDHFGRLSEVFGPNDVSHPAVWYDYELESRPVKITTHTKTEHNTTDSNKIFASYAFYDGLGRLIQTKHQAEDSTQQIVADVVTFNSQGKVKEKYLPYYVNIASEDEARAYSTPDYSGPKVSFQYDPVGRLTETSTLNDAGESISSTVQYERWTKISTDANGNKTRYIYDVYGQLSKVEEFNGAEVYTTSYTYDTQGNLIKTEDDQGNTTSITYDSLGRKTSMNDPDMGVWSYDYDAGGNLIKQTDAEGQVLEFEYDKLNRLTDKLAGGQTVVSYLYDEIGKPYCTGRLSKVTDLSGSTEFFYDNLGREIESIKTIEGTPYTVERTYDALDRLTTVTYPNAKVVSYTYNRQGGIETVETADGSISNINYTESGQIKLIQYSNGTETQYDYNSDTLRLRQLITSSPTEILQNLAYTFDNVSNVHTITDSSPGGTEGQVLEFEYDKLNRLTDKLADGQTIVSYLYDSIGNMTQKGDLTLAYGEDDAGPHAVTSITGSQTFSMSYDANGNMTDKGQTQYSYDTENRLIQVETAQDGGSQDKTIEISLETGWNFLGIPLELSDYSISSVLSSIEGKYDQVTRYNSETKKFESFINNSKFDQFDTFSFGEGYLIHVTEPCTLTVTSQTSIPQARDLKMGYNLIASPALEDEISTEVALNNLAQGTDYSKVCEYNGSAFTDDPATFKKGKAYYINMLQDKTWELPTTNREITTFEYDGDGGRVKKSTSDQTTIYIGSLYEERQTSEGTTYVYHIFNSANRAFSIETRGTETQTYFYHQDHIGSSNVITGQSGAKAQLLEYTPYGLTNRAEGDYNTNYRFTGKLFDNTGLYYYGARYYDPELGRFTQPDTIVQNPSNPQTLNRYSYCNNNPINYIDPTGHSWFKKFWKTIVGGFVGGLVGVLTFGAGFSLMAAGFFGGLSGGAVTGALEGGWKGMLIGGAMGGALGAFGGWGVHNFGAGFGYGMLAAGAGVAYGTGGSEGLQRFGAGVAGALTGATVGNAIDSYFHDPISFKADAGSKGPSENKNWRMLGIGTNDAKAQADANFYKSVSFYTRSRGIISDFIRAGIQKVFGNSLASRQFAGYLEGAEGVSIYTHSEGTVTLAGAIKALNVDGTKVQSLTIKFAGPVISKSTAGKLASSIGAKYKYELNPADPVGIFTTVNPVQLTIYGVLGTATGGYFHSTTRYP